MYGYCIQVDSNIQMYPGETDLRTHRSHDMTADDSEYITYSIPSTWTRPPSFGFLFRTQKHLDIWKRHGSKSVKIKNLI